MTITVTRLASGYWHIRGDGPCNWAQPATWPVATVEELNAFAEASPEFIRAALAFEGGAGVMERQAFIDTRLEQMKSRGFCISPRPYKDGGTVWDDQWSREWLGRIYDTLLARCAALEAQVRTDHAECGCDEGEDIHVAHCRRCGHWMPCCDMSFVECQVHGTEQPTPTDDWPCAVLTTLGLAGPENRGTA